VPVVLDNAHDRDGAGNVERVLGACQLRLQVPPTVQYLRTVRLVAADAADRAGFDCEETDDLRIAVDEMCHAMLRSTDAPITVGFSTEGTLVEVRGAAERAGFRRRLHLTPLSHLIVDAVSDEVELAEESWGIRFKLVKRGDRSQASSG
jgi:histidine kinase-like protein